MLKDNCGFIFIETLITFSIVLVTISIILPATVFIKSERQKLNDRQIIVTKLHDLMQPYIHDHEQTIPDSFTQLINEKHVHFEVAAEQMLIKGCANWENVKKERETFCLYAYEK